jgi:hypothetical protein
MFSHVMESGLQVKVALTPNNHVVLNLVSLARKYSLNITDTAWGQTILGVPVNSLKMAEDMAAIGRFFSAVNSHDVSLDAGCSYRIACPHTPAFRSRSVKLAGNIQERCAVTMLSCPACDADVAIPDHERGRYAEGHRLKVPAWRTDGLDWLI